MRENSDPFRKGGVPVSRHTLQVFNHSGLHHRPIDSDRILSCLLRYKSLLYPVKILQKTLNSCLIVQKQYLTLHLATRLDILALAFFVGNLLPVGKHAHSFGSRGDSEGPILIFNHKTGQIPHPVIE